jgi:surfactin synthase thioesterase subunit
MARASRTFALFGHSMGALLAYELAHALVGRARPPAHLIVSGCVAPNVPTAGPAVHRLPDAGLVEHVRSLDGTADEVLQHERMRRILLPVLRADFAVCETYRFPGHPPLAIPITVLGGMDDPTAPAGQLDAWKGLATGPMRVVRIAGGHFFLHERLDEVLGLVGAALGGAEVTPAG